MDDRIFFFPYLLKRIATGHHRLFAAVSLTNWKELADTLEGIGRQETEIRESISDILYRHISELAEGSVRRKLIQLRRDVFNGRHVDRSIFEGILYDPRLVNALQLLEEVNKKGEQLLCDFSGIYEVSLEESRRQFLELAKDDTFLKGLLLSSTSLYRQLKASEQSLRRGVKQKKQRRLEYSLLRYLSRMYYKTSPFSTFTYLKMGQLHSGNEGGELVSEYPVPAVKSKIRINNNLFKNFRNLLLEHPEINGFLPVRLNPSVAMETHKVRYFVNLENVESFQTSKRTPVVETIVEKLQGEGNLPLNELTAWLSSQLVQADWEATRAYLLKMIQMGILEFYIPVRAGGDYWHEELAGFIANRLPDGHFDDLKNTLKELQDLTVNLPEMRAEERNQLLQDVCHSLGGLFTRRVAELDGNPEDSEIYQQKFMDNVQKGQFLKKAFIRKDFRQEGLVYEDAYEENSFSADSKDWSSWVEPLERICTYLEALDPEPLDKQMLREFFKNNYGINASCIGLMDFYEVWMAFRKNRKQEFGELERQCQAVASEKRKIWLAAFWKHYKELGAGSDDEGIVLTSELFEKLREEKLMVESRLSCISRSAFLQVGKWNDREGLIVNLAVCNGVFPGMGKVAGRFLYLFKPEVTASMVRIHQEQFDASGNEIWLELSDASVFNANMHPPLLPFGLQVPGGEDAPCTKDHIPLRHLMLCYKPDTDELVLRSKTDPDKHVLPFDLSLQALSTRSKLYQFLVSFSPAHTVSWRPLVSMLWERLRLNDKNGNVVFFPRILFENNLLLQRKNWLVKSTCITDLLKAEEDALSFLRLNGWRSQHRIPRRVFVRMKPRPQPGSAEGDDYKPQFLDFEDPSFVRLLAWLMEKAGPYVSFEEMFPDTDGLDKEPVQEYWVQWYRHEKS